MRTANLPNTFNKSEKRVFKMHRNALLLLKFGLCAVQCAQVSGLQHPAAALNITNARPTFIQL